MGKKKSGVLDKLSGKKVVFNGKFEWGVAESLSAMAQAQGGNVLEDLDDSVDYLVLADANASKTIQKKAMTLNGKGASIQVIDGNAFKNMVEPSEAEVLELIRAGESETFTKIFGGPRYRYYAQQQPAKHTYSEEKFEGVSLKDVQFDQIAFLRCGFAGATLENVAFSAARECDFGKAQARECHFVEIRGSKFVGATLNEARFFGECSSVDFTGAMMENASFMEYAYFNRAKTGALAGIVFTKANLKGAKFHEVMLKAPDFDGADLSGAQFHQCKLESATFRNAVMRNTVLVDCTMIGADLSNSNLSGANLSNADLTDANLTGADLKGANLRGANLSGVDLSKAKNYSADSVAGGSVGPALTELDGINQKARRIQITFKVRNSADEEGEEVGIDSNGLQYGWGLMVPASIAPRGRHRAKSAMSDAMMQLANLLGNRQVRFETVEVSSTKSPKGGKELRDLVIQGIAEAFAQDIPAEEELAAATKTYRDAQREKGAADREQREKEKVAAEKAKEKEKKQVEKKIEKAVGKVTDTASFLKALEMRIEKPKIDKATKMLKASGFKLFNDVTGEYMSGVVKSQTDPDLVYACKIDQNGKYACCTQNLNICGGLRGSICKHLLVLIIGLVQAGELDPTTINEWVAKSTHEKAELDKEVMGAIFIKYKGAEAGEVDWRPTETVPEDYYSL